MATDILRNALEVIRALANTHLQNLDGRAEDWIALTSPSDQDGMPNADTGNKIVMTVYNITAATTVSTYPTTLPGQAAASPPLYLDLHLMFAANFAPANYGEGLAALSRLITYFQQTPIISHDNAPQLAPSINKLALEFANLGLADVRCVMDMLGTRYRPSVFYRLRMLPFVSSDMQSRGYPDAAPGLAETG